MLRDASVVIGLLCAVTWAQQPVLQCDDIDTKSCEGFHRARPDLCTDPTFSQSMCKRFCGNCPLECYSCNHTVNHPSECNTTETCGPDMRCVTKHLRAVDGHNEYLMRCENKELCKLLIDGFGKRDVEDDDDLSDEDRDRFERDVILNCCDKDLCNFEIEPTTVTKPTTTAATITVTATKPKSCIKDIVFVIRNYMYPPELANTWENFMYQIVSPLDVGHNDAQVSLIQDTQTEWHLDDYHTKSDVLRAIQHQRFNRTHSLIDASVKKVASDVLNVHHGDRAQAENVVVILQHGHSWDGDTNTIRAATQLHHISSDVIIVAVGSGIDSRRLTRYATDRHHIFKVSSFNSLNGILQNLVNVICS